MKTVRIVFPPSEARTNVENSHILEEPLLKSRLLPLNVPLSSIVSPISTYIKLLRIHLHFHNYSSISWTLGPLADPWLFLLP